MEKYNILLVHTKLLHQFMMTLFYGLRYIFLSSYSLLFFITIMLKIIFVVQKYNYTTEMLFLLESKFINHNYSSCEISHMQKTK